MNNMINSMKSILGKMSPQQMISQLLGGNSNPMINNLMQLAQKGDRQEIENFARNYCKERNIDFDSEFAKFMNNFK